MHSQTWTIASIQTHQSSIAKRIRELIPLKDSALKEAHARGLGFGTHAALKADIKAAPELSARAFDNAGFVLRIAELTDDITAGVVEGILDGIQLDISVVKRSEARQQSHRYSDIAYDVNVMVTPNSSFARTINGEIQFHLPEFGQGAGTEPYRVDSAHDRRVVTDYHKTHAGPGGTTLVAKLVDGHWYGGFFVYASEHQADDSQSIRSLRAALARAILPQLPTRVRCFIFRPDNYEFGAWRVEMRLTSAIQQLWSGSPFVFDLPPLPRRHIIMESGFRTGERSGRFIDGVWKADLYTNGIPEAENPTSLTKVKRALLQCVDQLISRAGDSKECAPSPVLDDAGRMVGTVQLLNGQYEAWTHARTIERPGNLHKFVGRFPTLEESTSAVLASL